MGLGGGGGGAWRRRGMNAEEAEFEQREGFGKRGVFNKILDMTSSK